MNLGFSHLSITRDNINHQVSDETITPYLSSYVNESPEALENLNNNSA